jgi:hypothetical protein
VAKLIQADSADAVTPAKDPLLRLRPDRRDWRHREALLRRFEAEFQEISGLCLRPAQAARLFGIRLDICERVLGVLADEAEVLALRSDGSYVVRRASP